MNLDLTEILKNCPKGTKFYSRCFGIVNFLKIQKDWILVADYIGSILKYDKNGKFNYAEESAEIDLFPSKDQRDWSKWHRPFIDGDILTYTLWNKPTIYIYRENGTRNTSYYAAYSSGTNTFYSDATGALAGDIADLRFANDEEKQKLFDIIKKNGYEWDSEKKELKKIEEKFDIDTLQEFDRVLARSNNGIWFVDIYSHFCEKDNEFGCVGGIHSQCVPYNDETKHLRGTSQQAPEKYINW